MKRVFLIVETPRAGEFGHRFLVPPGIRDERLVATIVEDSARNPVGKCHVAISRPAEQRLAGGSVRSGSESLILAGIAGERLTPDQLTSVQDGLKRLWAQLDTILQRPTGDDLSSRGILVNRGELDTWLERLSLVGLPNAILPTASSSVSEVWGGWLKRAVLGGLALVVLLLALVFLWFRSGVPGVGPGRTKDPGPTPSGSEGIQAEALRRLEELATRWGCEPYDVASSMCRASGMGPKSDGPVARVLLESSSRESFSKRLQSLSSDHAGSMVVFLPESERASEDLRKLLGNRDFNAALQLRNSLYLTWEAYDNLRVLIEKQGKPFEELDVTPSGFRKSMVFLTRMDREPGLGEGFVRPVTPVFERQDAMIIRLLDSWLVAGAGQGLSDALSQANVVVPDDEPLVARLERLHAFSSRIQAALVNERKDAVERASARKYKGSLDPTLVVEAYEAAEKYMALICNISTN